MPPRDWKQVGCVGLVLFAAMVTFVAAGGRL
jgi:hypothetical protein